MGNSKSIVLVGSGLGVAAALASNLWIGVIASVVSDMAWELFGKDPLLDLKAFRTFTENAAFLTVVEFNKLGLGIVGAAAALTAIILSRFGYSLAAFMLGLASGAAVMILTIGVWGLLLYRQFAPLFPSL